MSRPLVTALAGVLCSLAGQARGEPSHPLIGDRVNGLSLFRVQCAACHGADGRGHGDLAARLPIPPGDVRDPAMLATLSDDELRDLLLKGLTRAGQPTGMPGSPWLTSLEVADLIAFMREGQLQVADFFPRAQFFTAKAYPLDAAAQARLQRDTGHALAAGEVSVTVVTVFGDGPAGGPQPVPQDPSRLDKLDPKSGVGYLVFAELPHGKGQAVTGIAIGRDGKILRVESQEGQQHGAADKPYQGFVGQGKKGAPPALHAKGKGPPEKAFEAAYARALEGIAVADKEERDRHWADTK